jgi:hypothetical protein
VTDDRRILVYCLPSDTYLLVAVSLMTLAELKDKLKWVGHKTGRRVYLLAELIESIAKRRGLKCGWQALLN